MYEVSDAEAQAGYTDLYFLKIEEGDTAEAAITLSDGTKLKKVKKEEMVIPALGHKWGGWSVTKQATLTKKGEKKRTCSVCGETETQATPYTIKGAKVVLSKAAFTYSGKVRKPSVKTIGGKKLVTVKGYKKVSKKVTKLKGKKKYYVRVRTFKTIKGVKYYSPWSRIKTVKTR